MPGINRGKGPKSSGMLPVVRTRRYSELAMQPHPPGDPTIVLRLHVGCQHCGYDLFGLGGDPIRCPECGGQNSYAQLVQLVRRAPEPEITCAIAALLGGPLLWVGPALIAGRNEAWDSAWGWLWFGGTLAASAALGFIAPRRWWAWPLVAVGAQCFTAVTLSGAGPLWCLGAGIFLLVGCAALAAAGAGSAFGRLERHGWKPGA